jgi:hypothetical protein
MVELNGFGTLVAWFVALLVPLQLALLALAVRNLIKR